MPSNSTIASSVPAAMVSGSPTASKRVYRPRSARKSGSRTLAASANRTQTRVTSAMIFTASCDSVRLDYVGHLGEDQSDGDEHDWRAEIGAGEPSREETPRKDHQGDQRNGCRIHGRPSGLMRTSMS